MQPRPVKDKEKSGGGRGDHAREFAPQAMGILTRLSDKMDTSNGNEAHVNRSCTGQDNSIFIIFR